MNRELIEDQIGQCRILQSHCEPENIDAFLQLSDRIIQLDAMLSEQQEKKISLEQPNIDDFVEEITARVTESMKRARTF